jgi:membrane protease YdiL (CAAX protease family)
MAPMHGRPLARRKPWSVTGPLIVVLAAWNNVVVPRLPGRPGVYEAVNGTAAGALLGIARTAGLSRAELGLSGDRLRAGAGWGGAAAAMVAAGLAAGTAVPSLRPLLRDARVAGLGNGAVAYRVLLRIPVGTVLWEEVAFRGVLHAALSRELPARAAAAAGAALFGIWHVHPTSAAIRANAPGRTPTGRWIGVLLGCTGTAAAGALFTSLRQRSGSLLAPVLLHLAANSGGLLAAVAADRRRGRDEASAAQGSSGRPV